MDSKKKYLIVNADDFGVATETNKAIFELYSSKKISSVSFMPVASFRDDAIELAKKIDMPLGVHWAFNSDYDADPWKPISPREDVKSLVNSLGYFSTTKFFRKNATHLDVTCELIAQYEYIINKGLKVDHADSHCGTLYGINGRRFYIDAFNICSKYDLPFRFPSRTDFIKNIVKNRILYNCIKIPHRIILNNAKKRNVKIINTMISNNMSDKDIKSYKDYENNLIKMIKGIEVGLTEFFSHPSYQSVSKNGVSSWNKIRVYDLEFLNSEKFSKVISDYNIEICDYSILKKMDFTD
ncbi:MAG: ChbG/HpnK family deacetylase [Christensenellaceae bacterium]|jgi:predicted glycoside hydrolase/deacetylase ChbG (UPF0249 family)|nr:ChbG/HpnK family deacetylase [Christensenellaceae bacterium]